MIYRITLEQTTKTYEYHEVEADSEEEALAKTQWGNEATLKDIDVKDDYGEPEVEVIVNDGPRYKTDDHEDGCKPTFLGRHEQYDMYYCSTHGEYIARHGDSEEDYVSADVELAGVHRILQHAIPLYDRRTH